jgi:hypothetical protein
LALVLPIGIKANGASFRLHNQHNDDWGRLCQLV